MASILSINGGSSSIKFAFYDEGDPLVRGLHGSVGRIGQSGAHLTFNRATETRQNYVSFAPSAQRSVASSLIDWLEAQPEFASINAIGHRIVHGMQHAASARVDEILLQDLRRISPYHSEHLPSAIKLIEALAERHPKLAQIACFDTSFHHNMPRIAQLLPLPRRFDAKGMRRFGFHGLSYAYLIEQLERIGDPAATRGRVIIAHLGNGASLAAVRNGHSIDTSMGFSPTSGLMMSSRSGDLDPGLVYYLARTERMTAAQFHRMVNRESGLLGVSETSSDMRELIALAATDHRATEAIALFCYQAKKMLGAFSTVLEGLDTVVFSGGIGEHLPSIRQRICDGLSFLGIELDPIRNLQNAAVISSDASRVSVRVIPTDEEVMIARSVRRTLASV